MSSIIKVDQIQLTDGTSPTAVDLGFAAGSVIQVVHNDLYSASYSATTNTSFVEVNSAFRTSITPKYATSKILVVGGLGVGIDRVGAQDANGNIRIREINSGDIITQTGIRVYDRGGSGVYLQWGQTLSKLYSPATTSTLTYTWDFKLIVGQDIRANDENRATYFTLYEIAG